MLAGEVVTLVLYVYLTKYCARADWVEISQNGYRRGSKPQNTRNGLVDEQPSSLTTTTTVAAAVGFPAHHPPSGGGGGGATPTRLDTGFQRGVDRFDFDVIQEFHDTRYDRNLSSSLLKKTKPFGHGVNIPSIEKVSPNPFDVLKTDREPGSPVDGLEYMTAKLFNDKTTQRIIDDASSQEIGSIESVKKNRIGANEKNIEFSANSAEKLIISTDDSVDELTETRGARGNRNTSEDTTATLQSAKNDHFKTIAGIIKVIKLVQDIITKNSHRTIRDKSKYLQDLSDAIMINIEDRMVALWPAAAAAGEAGGAGAGAGRGARSSKGEHVDFPSAESALMSISFLTFAVFLIKLVMQVIQTYKSKAMMVTPLFTAASRALIHRSHALH